MSIKEKQTSYCYFDPDVYEDEKCEEVHSFMAQDLSEFILFTPLFRRSLANLLQAFCIEEKL